MQRWEDTSVKQPCLRGNVGRAPCLHYTLAFALQLNKIIENPSVMVAEKSLAEER